MKKLLFICAALTALESVSAAAVDAMNGDPDVKMTALKVQQHYPWNGKVDIDFTFTSSVPEAFAFIHFKARYVNKAGETVEVPMKTFEQVTLPWCTNAGSYRVTWNSAADAPALQVTNLKYTVTANMAKYMVIDLSKGTKASADNRYPISYYEDVPDFPGVEKGKWDDYHKTTNLVLRLIQPGQFIQGWSDPGDAREGRAHTAILTKPYYLGVFETTQGQYHLLTGSYGTSLPFTGGRRLLRPTTETYQNIRGRGYNGTINWPKTGSAVAADSFLRKLRDRIGTEGFDLPTECEWEYASRCGGSASGFWNDGSDAGIPTSTKFNTVKDGNEAMERLGRYRHNGGMIKTWDEAGGTNIYTAAAASSDESLGTAVVGSYIPNAWGLYDMHGNVAELTNGHWPGITYATTDVRVDDVGQVTQTWGQWGYRIARGGDWNDPASSCLVPRRGVNLNYERAAFGFRLCWRFETPAQE